MAEKMKSLNELECFPKQQDVVAQNVCEIYIGSDAIIRINVDGVCALRINMRIGNPILCIESPGETVVATISSWIETTGE